METGILRVDERVNICYMIYTGDLLRILPDRDDPSHTWHSPRTIHQVYRGEDSLFASSITQLYLEAVGTGMQTGDWSLADEYLGYIRVFQERTGGEIIPSELKQKTEILYNRISFFDRLARFYLAIGLVLLLIQLINVPGKKIRFARLRRVMVIHLLAGLGFHSLGLALRWYISGHAPWSNGYESLIYISWATLLAGALFSRRTYTPLAATAVLSWMILHTAHLSWMDPQMTNLVPVLKSYWLTIHVAVIASSYGFLALAALMGFLNLLLMALQNSKNRQQARFNIVSLSGISEMTIIAGLGLLTIGTFLGGIWANESWGRYWAWDAKESWALITIFVYAFIAHMRFIPGLKHLYAFNLALLLIAALPVGGTEYVALNEHLDSYLPGELWFVTEDSVRINLVDMIDKPTVISPVYYNCPGLCTPIMDGITKLLNRTELIIGKDFQVINISFHEGETPRLASIKKSNYLELVEDENTASHWHFLTGEKEQINSLLNTLGYSVMRHGEDILHPAAIIIVSPSGKITKYIHGTKYNPIEFKIAIQEAALGHSMPTFTKVLKMCFNYEPSGRSRSRQVTILGFSCLPAGPQH